VCIKYKALLKKPGNILWLGSLLEKLLWKKVLVPFILKDIIKHKFIVQKNLYEICYQYPSQVFKTIALHYWIIGIGFQVCVKRWQRNSYWTIKEVSFSGMLSNLWISKTIKSILKFSKLSKGASHVKALESSQRKVNDIIFIFSKKLF